MALLALAWLLLPGPAAAQMAVEVAIPGAPVPCADLDPSMNCFRAYATVAQRLQDLASDALEDPKRARSGAFPLRCVLVIVSCYRTLSRKRGFHEKASRVNDEVGVFLRILRPTWRSRTVD